MTMFIMDIIYAFVYLHWWWRCAVLRRLLDGILGRCHGFLCLCDLFRVVLLTLLLYLMSELLFNSHVLR
jgi:hypothetical protein